MDSEGGSGNGKHPTIHTESSHDGDPFVDRKISHSSSSSSSTSSASSFDPLTDLDYLDIIGNSTTKSVINSPASPTAEFEGILGNSTTKSICNSPTWPTAEFEDILLGNSTTKSVPNSPSSPTAEFDYILGNSTTKSVPSGPCSPTAEFEGILGNSTIKSLPKCPTSPFAKLPEASENSVHTEDWSMVSTSPRAGPENSSPTPVWSMVNACLKQSPPIQTMWRPVSNSGYDPNRIPSSVFTSRPNTGMEWSVASNESLFSIQMGNNSFSADQAILLGKSEELGRPDEFYNSNFIASIQQNVNEAKFNELNSFNSPPTPSIPTVIEVASDDVKNSASVGKENKGLKQVVEEKPKVVVKETEAEQGKEITPPRLLTTVSSLSDGKENPLGDGARFSASTPRLSDESGTSGSSFAFPLLSGECGRSLSVRVAPENLQKPKPPERPKPKPKPHPQPQEALVVTPKAAEQSWFSCFSCQLLCC